LAPAGNACGFHGAVQGLTDSDGLRGPDAGRSGVLDFWMPRGATQAVRSSCWPARTAPFRDSA